MPRTKMPTTGVQEVGTTLSLEDRRRRWRTGISYLRYAGVEALLNRDRERVHRIAEILGGIAIAKARGLTFPMQYCAMEIVQALMWGEAVMMDVDRKATPSVNENGVVAGLGALLE